MKSRYGRLLLWAVTVLRAVGGLPYTWTASEHPEALLYLRRRRGLLVWSGIVVFYLLTTTIYMIKEAIIIVQSLNTVVEMILYAMNVTVAMLSPVIVFFSILWKSDKMANIIRLINLVEVQTTNRSNTDDGHISISLILIGTILCSVCAPVISVMAFTHMHSTLQRILYGYQKTILIVTLILCLVVVTNLMLEITDLTENVTTNMASQHTTNLMTHINTTAFKQRYKHVTLKINNSLIMWNETLLQALNEAAKDAQDYIRIPLLVITMEAFMSILISCYIMGKSRNLVSSPFLVVLVSFIGRLWCAMHVVDIYKNKVSFVFLSNCRQYIFIHLHK